MLSKAKLEQLAMGAVMEAFDHELQNVVQNVLDPNTEAKAKREISIKIKVKPNEHRNMADVEAHTASKLAPARPVETTLLFDRDKKGKPLAAELGANQGAPGQFRLPIDGEDQKEEQPSNVTQFNREAKNA